MKYGPLLLGERVAHHVQHRLCHAALIADVQVRMPAQGVMRQRRLEDVPAASRADHLLACVLSCFQIKHLAIHLITHHVAPPRPGFLCGFGGKEAKAARDVLLKHLKGHSAFQSDAQAQKHRDKYAAIRRSHKEILDAEAQHDE